MSRAAAINKFNETLIKLFNGVENIFRYQTIEKNTWMELYRTVYECCTDSGLVEWTLYATATGRQKYLLAGGAIGTGRWCGGELYYNLENYFIHYVKNLCQMTENMSEEDLLRFYVDQWKKYQYSSKMLNCTFLYLHQHWIPFVRLSGFTSIYETSTLLMLIWQEVFLKPIGNRLTNSCLNMINTERHAHVITNTQLIKGMIDSYLTFNFENDMQVWFHEEPSTIPARNIYKEWFEVPFLNNTKRFYRMEANKDLNESLIQYLTKVSRYLNEEEHRGHSYLRFSSIQSFLTGIEEILLHDRLNDICDEVRNILSKNNYQDLKCLMESMRRFSMAKNRIKLIIQDHIYQIGYQSIDEISTKAIQDPKIYVKTIVEIYGKCSQLIQDIFLNDLVFVDAFNQACSQFINTNAVTSAGKKSSLLLAHYCNQLLRNNKKILQESDFEKNLTDFTIIFNYIEDKDAFELFYRKFLSKRLINQQRISYDYEEMIISKLKQICGWIYTSKLEKMLQDVSLSEDLVNKYQRYCTDEQITHPFHFSGMILSSNSWTLPISNDFILPKQLQSVLSHFTKFYTSQHNGRKLKFLDQYSTGELKMFSTKQKHILQVSTYQMAVLLLFNESNVWTVEQIQNKTQLNLEMLLTSFHHLLKSKILLCDTDIDKNSTLRLAEDFRNPKIRINLNLPLKSVEQKEVEDVHRTIDEDRRMVIQAAIIRIMKARQTLKHALLMQEVIEQLRSRFKPEIPIIKKCIDLLIEKEYLERDSNDKDLLRYLA